MLSHEADRYNHHFATTLMDVVEEAPTDRDYRPVRLVTDRGTVHGRLYPAPRAKTGVIWVGGAGGGFDTPAHRLYPRMSVELLEEQTTSLRLQYRNPHDLEEAVHDVSVGLCYLRHQGIEETAVVGHSFGGAVIMRAAAHDMSVRAAVALSTQSYGAEHVQVLGPRCALLLLHGRNDRVLPPGCSAYVYTLAREPRKLVFFPGAGHNLDEAAGQVREEIWDWLEAHLLG